MDRVEVVKAYFEALDAQDLPAAGAYLDEHYQLVDFQKDPMDKAAVLDLIKLLGAALPNLTHSLYNLRDEDGVVKATVQRSGTNSGLLDLRKMGLGVIPRSHKFIIFPNGNYEFTVVDGKITQERDVSAVSPNRRWSGLLRAFGVNGLSL